MPISDYRITVRGEIPPRLTNALAPLECDARDGRTTITGEIVDRCHMFGVLDHVRNLGMELIEVAPLDPSAGARTDDEGDRR